MMVRDRVFDLHLVEQHHVGPAQIGGTDRDALAALGACRDEAEDRRAVDHRLVHRGVELGDGDRRRLGERAGEHTIVTADARHRLAFGECAQGLSRVAHC